MKSLRGMVGQLLPRLNAAFPTAVLAELVGFLTAEAGATSVRLWLADYDEAVLAALGGPGGTEPAEVVDIGHGGPGEAFASQDVVTTSDATGITVHLPVSLRAERLGVLTVGLGHLVGPSEAPADPVPTVALTEVAMIMAYVLATAMRYTDSFERARRREPLNVAAEMQWSLVAARAFSAPQFALAGQVRPAYHIGGDAYDFCVGPSSLWLAVIDAMGHGTQAAVLTTLALTTLRNARRGGESLAVQVETADRTINEVFGGGQFVTGLILQVNLETGSVEMVNAGHPSPYLVRGGQVERIEVDPHLPIGLFEEGRYTSVPLELVTGDRWVFVSDGVTEAVTDESSQFGDTRLAQALADCAGATAHETVERLYGDLQRAIGDDLRDDATVIVVDWKGPSG